MNIRLPILTSDLPFTLDICDEPPEFLELENIAKRKLIYWKTMTDKKIYSEKVKKDCITLKLLQEKQKNAICLSKLVINSEIILFINF